MGTVSKVFKHITMLPVMTTLKMIASCANSNNYKVPYTRQPALVNTAP